MTQSLFLEEFCRADTTSCCASDCMPTPQQLRDQRWFLSQNDSITISGAYSRKVLQTPRQIDEVASTWLPWRKCLRGSFFLGGAECMNIGCVARSPSRHSSRCTFAATVTGILHAQYMVPRENLQHFLCQANQCILAEANKPTFQYLEAMCTSRPSRLQLRLRAVMCCRVKKLKHRECNSGSMTIQVRS